MHLRLHTLLLAAAIALSAAACDDNTDTTTTTPTSTTTTTETFTGTIQKNGATTHQFSSTSRGSVTATLTSLAPDNTVKIGVSLGTWNGTSCQIILANDQTTVGSGLVGTVSGVGNLCLRIYDAAGNLSVPTTYSIDVVHP
jgi:hypothetical protein